MGFRDKWKEQYAEEKRKQEEKDRIKAEKRANMSETDKIAKEAYGTAKILFVGKYAFQIFFGGVVLFFVGWFILDSVWNWFTGLF